MNGRIVNLRNRLHGRHAMTVREWSIVCGPCQIDVPGHDNRDEAAYLAGIHNDLHHGSRPDAGIAPVQEPHPDNTSGGTPGGTPGGFGGAA